MTWGAIKRTPGDAAFSDFIRERAQWRCERCGRDCSSNRQGLHASHFKTRANVRVRFDEENVWAMCMACHDFLGKNPDEHDAFVRRRLGEDRYNALMVRANARRTTRLDHKFEAIRWRAALRDLRKKTQGKIMGARS